MPSQTQFSRNYKMKRQIWSERDVVWSHAPKKTKKKHRFLTTLKLKWKKKMHAATDRLFAPPPVSAWPKSLLQFEFKIMKMREQIKKITGQVLTYNSILID